MGMGTGTGRGPLRCNETQPTRYEVSTLTGRVMFLTSSRIDLRLATCEYLGINLPDNVLAENKQ